MNRSFFFCYAAMLSLGGCFLSPPLGASPLVLHVDSRGGSDQNPGSEGAPLKTVARAVALAKAGDTIALVPGQPPLHEGVFLADRSGAPQRPVILEGGGNVLDGQRPVVAAEWEKVRPGLYRNVGFAAFLFPDPDSEAMLRRFYFRFGDKVERMGRAGKGANRPLPPPERLLPGQWTYVGEEKTFYLAIDPTLELADLPITYPYLLNGVATRGDCRHWVVRNLTVRHFLNDGFNLHGSTRDFLLENVAARDCGDDGLSAHGRCEFRVDGFTASGNTTGICHIGWSRGTHRRLRLEENVTYNLCLLGSGEHSIADSVVSAREGVIRFSSKKEKALQVHLERVEILWPEGGRTRNAFVLEEGVRLFTSEMPPLEEPAL